MAGKLAAFNGIALPCGVGAFGALPHFKLGQGFLKGISTILSDTHADANTGFSSACRGRDGCGGLDGQKMSFAVHKNYS